MELNLEQISNKKFKFTWEDELHSTDIEVSIPKLENLEQQSWGDWGQNYKFNLTEKESVQIKYNNDVVDINQKVLSIETPFLAKEREDYPHYLIIEDEAKKLRFNLYLNKNYELGKAVVDLSKKKDLLVIKPN